MRDVMHKTATDTVGKRKKTATRGIQIWNTDKAQKIKEKKQSNWAFL
jgi:hypothetical protein